MIQNLLARRRDLVLALADVDAEITSVLAAGQQDVPVPDDDRLLEISEVAERLGLKVSYVYSLVRRNAIPSIRVGKFIKVRLAIVRDIEQGRRRIDG